MDLGINNRVALVMGAGGGLGVAIAASLAREGVRVAGGDVNLDALDQTRQAIAASGGKFLPIRADLSDLASLDAAVAAVENQFGPVDILVNNTGGPPPTTAAG